MYGGIADNVINGILGEMHDAAHILFHCTAHLLILVRVDQRADSLIGEHLREQPFVDAAIDYVHSRNACLTGRSRVGRFG